MIDRREMDRSHVPQNMDHEDLITGLQKIHENSLTDIHLSVHREYNSKLQPTRCNVS